MIVDASAILAIIFREHGHEPLLEKISEATTLGIGAPTAAETGIVLTNRLGDDGSTLLVRFLHQTRTAVIPFTDSHWHRAIDAYRQYGKGRHRAGLNFGDCLSYAVASLARQPLLCLGDDFRRTDLELA